MSRAQQPLRLSVSCFECWRTSRIDNVHHLSLLAQEPSAWQSHRWGSRQLSSSAGLLSGHSRWSKIRHKKGAADSQRGVLFSKLTNEIYLALRPPNSPDPTSNPRLNVALQKAKENALPKANVDNAFQKALNPSDGVALQSVTYEAIGAGGQVALIIECLTDNQNRSVQRVKEQLRENGARFSPVAFQFERKGIIRVYPVASFTTVDDTATPPTIESVNDDEQLFETLFELVVEAGAEDVRLIDAEEEGGESDKLVFEVTTPPSLLSPISTQLSSTPSYSVRSIELAYIPTQPLTVPDEVDVGSTMSIDEGDQMISSETADKVVALLDGLDGVPEVTRVWTNVKGL